MSRRLKLGEVVEIQTPPGLLYAQAVNYHASPPTYGTLLRIPVELFTARPDSFFQRTSVAFFCPLHLAVELDYPDVDFRRIGQFDIADEWRDFPVFREEALDPEEKRDRWRLWDGRREWRVDDLTPEELVHYPLLRWGTPYALVDTVFDAIGFQVDTPTLNRWFGIDRVDRDGGVEHYLYFPTKPTARDAATRLESRGHVDLQEVDGTWRVLLRTDPRDEEEFRAEQTELDALAKELGGTYDGYDVAV